MKVVDAIERGVDREFARLGVKLAVPIHARIREIIRELYPHFPITGLDMGNGTYFLRGEPFAVVYSDWSKGTVPMIQLLDFDEGKVWEPVSLLSDTLSTKHRKRLIELRELLDYLTGAPYLPLLTLSKKELAA